MAERTYLLDKCRAATTTGGTGALSVGASPVGYLSPAQAGAVSGRRYTWLCESDDGATWELFEGVYTAGSPPTISRNRIIRNSSGTTSAVNWPAGTTKRITCVIASDRAPTLNTDGLLDPAYLPALPYAPSATWSGTVDLSTTPTEFIAINVPDGARAIIGGLAARGENQATSLATVAIDVILRTPGGTIVQQFPDAAAVAGNSIPRFWQIGGTFAFSTAADGGYQSLTLAIRARKDLAIGPYNINQISAGLMWNFG